jgi:hypothetical protein
VKTEFDAPFGDLTCFDASQTWYRVEQVNDGQARKRLSEPGQWICQPFDGFWHLFYFLGRDEATS